MNRVRGDAPIVIDGVERRLRLTFGALAEIESGLGVESLADMGARLAKLSSNDLMLVLAALLRGGGEGETAARIAEARIDLGAAATAVAEAFAGAAR